MWSSTIGRRAPLRERHGTKGKLMNIGRGGALTALALLVAIGCGGSDGKVMDQAGGGGPGHDGGTAADEDSPPPPPPVGGAPSNAVFVSASKGLDDGDGSMTRPFKTIAAGLALALERPSIPVVVCAETYAESVKLIGGVTMYGYFDCSNLEQWQRVDGAHAVVASPTSPAVVAEKMAYPTAFEGFEVRAPDMTAEPSVDGPAASSVAMLIRESSRLSIAHVTIRSGRGQAGLDGSEPTPNEQLKAADGEDGGSQGIVGSCTFNGVFICSETQFVRGGAGGTSQCEVGGNGGAGGQGGDGMYFIVQAQGSGAVFSGRPLNENATTSAGGAEVAAGAATTGKSGTRGPSGYAGANGTWKLDASGFVPGDGSPGTDGVPGKGGGGGGGSRHYYCNASFGSCSPTSPTNRWYGAKGGGGGAGGCAGLAGTAGKGGGASIGLLVIGSSKIKIDASRIEGGPGGKGGKGALGSTGMDGGSPGTGGSTGQAFERGGFGGLGGRGGDGGPSGHGDPGPSIALAYAGTRPDLSLSVVLSAGAPGPGQPALVRGDQVVQATDGKAMPEHAFSP